MKRGLLIDLDGVLYLGEKAIPGARAVVSWLQSSDYPFLFVTNTTSRPRHQIVEKLHAMGMEISEHSIITPVFAASLWIKQNVQGEVALFIPEATRADMQDIPSLEPGREEGAAAVVIGDLGVQWTYEQLNRAFRLLMHNPSAPLLALGMTRYWRAEDGLRLDVAPFVRALETATDKEAIVLGKPSADFFNMCLSLLGLEAEQVFMVGDDIRSDVAGAQAAGIWGVLVQTGKFQESDLDSGIDADVMLNSIAQLPDWLERIQA
ncbi:MAG: TIGR01458 family HAD-type hydrolase [Gammaproteobacteria bacterium]|nr:TIGR01458 family HAD-type hydrolase [Gammaproteobacteria bacterium]